MTKTEEGIQEILKREEVKMRQVVVKDLIAIWDREKIGRSFPDYLITHYALFWKAKALLN